MSAPRIRCSDKSLEDAFEAFSDYLDELPKPKRIVAGMHILSAEDEEEIVLTGTPAGESTPVVIEKCPLDAILTVDSDDADKYNVTATAGTVNQLLVSNYNEEDGFATIEKDEVKYLILHIDFDSDGKVTDAELSLEADKCEVLAVEADALPTSIDIMVGVIEDLKWTRTLSCGSVVVFPFMQYKTADENWWSYKVEVW